VLRALNDWGDDSPEGELTDGIIDQIAKFERAKTAERTRRGRLRKAREGKIVAIGDYATYGFKHNAMRDGYIVEEKTMRTVRRIFRMIGKERMSLYGVKRALESEGIPTPNGGSWWNTSTIRDIVLDDCYRPYPYEEIEELVSLQVAAALNKSKTYGVSWYNSGKERVYPLETTTRCYGQSTCKYGLPGSSIHLSARAEPDHGTHLASDLAYTRK
jgi:hypothetical protein